MSDLPTVMTAAGLQPVPPATILAALLARVAASNPGYTANLPGSLIEDISSTDVAAIALMDAAKVELVNCLTPFGANAFLLNALGEMYGVRKAPATVTSVNLVFTGPPGFLIAEGFTVGDGTYHYVVREGGIIASGGETSPLYAEATQEGSWAVPSGTVQQLVTSVPDPFVVTVNNPTAGVPAASAETETSFRARVLQAGLADAQGMATFLKTQVAGVQGVQARLVSMRQVTDGWTVIVGGGDPYEVAYAIYRGDFNIPGLQPSTLSVTAITNANPGVVTTDQDHNYETGQVIGITGVVGTAGINGVPLTATVLTGRTFSIGINTTASGAYVSGGVVTPNLRNVAVSINDYPDTYVIPFVDPPLQTVAMTVTWDTISPNFVSPAAVAQLGAPALAAYVNSIAVGQPINLFELQATFQEAVENILPSELLTRMVFAVSINGVGVNPTAGTGIIAGDPESYFFAVEADIDISQG